MGILRFMLHAAGRVTVVIALLGVAAGAANGALIATVHRALSDPAAIDVTLGLTFFGLVVARVVANFATAGLVLNYGQESVTQLRNRVVRGILAIDLRQFERIGRSRALTAITQDAAMIGGAMQMMPTLVVSAAMTAGGACYLLYLSPTLFVLFLLAGVVAAVAGTAVRRSGAQRMREARQHYDTLFGHLRTLIDGIKELKLHAGRREEFLNRGVVQAAEELMTSRIRAQTRFLELNALNSTLHMLVIGGVLFLLPIEMEPAVLSGYILTILYILGPSSGLIRAASSLSQASIALQRIDDLGLALADAPRERRVRDSAVPPFESVHLEGVVFDYGDADEFTLGPVDLALKPGQLTVITGANGSGKSTLARLLTGLYIPSAGTIRWNGEPVDEGRRDAYRQLYSAVLFDFHLFEQLWGLGGSAIDRRATQLLAELQLTDVVSVQDGQLNTTDLSSGQRRRVALLTALLEKRPIYVLDEIGADQDPEFRAWIYERLIPRLVDGGKAVVLITHDDGPWQDADQHLKLQRPPRTSAPPATADAAPQ